MATGVTGQLFGTDLIELRHGTPLVFTHRAVNKGVPLRIYGANAIKWAYQLITRSQQTYGGEVVQILGAYVAPMQITGHSRSKTEYETIRKWFLQYMTIAGLERRNQEPIKLTYAERGWSFLIQVTEMPWSVAVDKIADEWAITAEIVHDNSTSKLSEVSMANYTFSPDFINKFGDIGFTPATDDQFDSATLGENFNRLLASWVSGDYNTFGFQSSSDPTTNFETDADQFYINALGTEYLIEPAGGGGGSLSYTGGEPSTKLDIVAAIFASFEAADMPGRLGVAVAGVETGGTFDPDKRNDAGYMGLFQTQPGPTGKSQANVLEARQARDNPDQPVTKYYPASLQIAHATDWFKGAAPDDHSKTSPKDTAALLAWAVRAQGFGDQADEVWTKRLKEADALIKQAKEAGAGGGAVLGDTYPGSPVPGNKYVVSSTNFTHQTGGLDGYPAYDYMAPAGTPCVAPVAGTIERLSGKDPKLGGPPGGPLGYSIYLTGTNGKSYYMTHLDKVRVKAGDRVAQGQQIAEVADGPSSWSSPHVHMGVKG